MNNRAVTILNYSMVIIYTAALMLAAAIAEVLLALGGITVPAGLDAISIGLAGTGFQVTVIAVSILTVITNMSEKRYFGIKAGEYLKFRRKRFTPGFYDNLVVIILIGALQYAALGIGARFAAAVMFFEITALLIVQIRWGLGIAFFYYGKEKEIRAFFLDELNANMAMVFEDVSNAGKSKKGERAAQALSSRIDQLFAHTKHAATLRESTELTQNLGMLTHVFKLLLRPECHTVWHNYETRVDYLLAALLSDEEQREYAVTTLSNMLDIIVDAMSSEENGDGIVKNCDFDNSRNTVYQMLAYTDVKTLKSMFEKRLFYKMAIVKIFGIESDQRKVLRYRHYTGQFAQNVKSSPYLPEVVDMIIGSIVWLAPMCFPGGKISEAGLYVCLMTEALAQQEIDLHEAAPALTNTYFGDTDKEDENRIAKQRSVYILMLMFKDALGIDTLPEVPPLNDKDQKVICDMAKLLGREIAMPSSLPGCK